MDYSQIITVDAGKRGGKPCIRGGSGAQDVHSACVKLLFFGNIFLNGWIRIVAWDRRRFKGLVCRIFA